MAQESKYVLEPLRDGTNFTLYRGTERGDQMPILAVAVTAEQPSPQSLLQLEYEYSLATELDAAWAAHPIALTRDQGRTVLILRDPGGEPLDRVIAQHQGQPIGVTRFLRVGIGLADALGQAHQPGLIHKAVKPENVLVDDAGHAWLTGFGIASRLPRERQAPASPEIIAGTLAYMSPEQTGRMNRSVDSRSDLYSLGVTLYQILTGTLPFTATDPLEWVHCHIARQPTAPVDRCTVPESVSAIIMKLLAKNAEDRYQTAVGLAADLRRCLTEWQSHGRIEPFPLGADDASDRLLIPEKLYGREREVEILLTAFNRVVAQGSAELVLVSGYSGVGKSSVVNELHRVLVPPRGLFAAGKFDQYRRDVPYATLAEAFQHMVRQILVKGETEVGHWRRVLLGALGPNGQLMVNLIPELEFIIGKQAPVAELPPQEARGRFHLVFQRFLSAFARPEHPLALFLDDLQWLDAATLELLERLATDPDVRHVLLIGAYRDNEVNSSHPLMQTLARIRDTGARVQEIVLAPLGLDDVKRLIADSLHHQPNSSAALAQLVHDKTGGNPFFAIQFLISLVEEGLLRFNRGAPGWGWDADRIRAKGYSDNVVDLMLGKLRRLSDTTQVVLQKLSCLGNAAKIATLQIVLGQSEEDIHVGFLDAARTGLILRLEGSYAFLHDRVQEAAYSLIPQELRAEAHLRIGMRMASHLPPDELEEEVFEIVNQLNRGSHLITSIADLERIAELNLIAARRAKISTAYASAIKYLRAGRGLLKDETWSQNYSLIFPIESLLAECELLTGEMVAAENRLSMLAGLAKTSHDIALVTRLRLTLYNLLDRGDRGMEVFLDYQRSRGRDWSTQPSDEEVSREYDHIRSLLGSRQIEELVDLPLMTNSDLLDALDVLTEVAMTAMFADENLLALVLCRIVSLSLEHGNSDASCFAYLSLGVLAGPHFGDYEAGFLLGQLGYELVERRGLHRYQARVYLRFGNHVMPWKQHVKSGRELTRRSFDAANKIGDLTFAAYSFSNLNTNFLAAGDSLPEVQREAEDGLEFARKVRFVRVIDQITTQVALIRTLRGLTTKLGSFNDGHFEELEFERHLSSDRILAIPECWYWIRKLQALFFAGDYSSAILASLNAKPLLWTSQPYFELAEYHFYSALSLAGAFHSTSKGSRGEQIAALADHHRQLEIWAENCPDNFENRAALVSAEIARIEGRGLDAIRLYERAIESAQENGFVHNEAIGNELAGRFYLACGAEAAGFAYLRNARNCFDRWGAGGKVKQLDELYPRLRQDGTPASSAIVEPAVRLDVESVVKASQAISSEMVLPKLIEKLMRIAMEHAGAERGLLILTRDGEPQIEAEATTRPSGIEVALRQEPVVPRDLPQSALLYVIRTQERVLLDDASADRVYSQDEYVRVNRSKSVLCLPIVKQARLIGALYLENNLTPFVFTPVRVTVLQLLASQAAISLENANLYTDLQLQVGLLQRLPVSAWTLKPDGTPDFVNQVWLEFAGQTLEFVQSHPEAWMTVVHPEDRELAAKDFWEGIHSEEGFAFETRSLRARDGAYRWHLQQAVVLRDPEGKVLKFVGTTTDIDDQKRAEDALRQAQGDLARANRATTMGELTASLAHELSQPISGAMTNANVGLRKLGTDSPDLDEVRGVFSKIVRDAQRAAEIIRRIRSQFEKSVPNRESLDVNEIIPETIALLRDEAVRNNISVRTELAPDLPQIIGDRVQLQQVAMNLIVNGIEAMKDVDGIREMIIRSQRAEKEQILVSVSDTGVGIPPQLAEQIFDPFFTTKAHGTGMGLRICRSIIEAHGGRLWATNNDDLGATFLFSIPYAISSGDEVRATG